MYLHVCTVKILLLEQQTITQLIGLVSSSINIKTIKYFTYNKYRSTQTPARYDQYYIISDNYLLMCFHSEWISDLQKPI